MAGESGFIRLSDDGEGYVRGDGSPLRLWGVAAHAQPAEKQTEADLAAHARFLARMGCNVVRVGGANAGLVPQEEGAPLDEPSRAELDKVWRTVAAMKKEGIYTRFSAFWDHGSVKYINPDWGLEGYQSGDRLNALVFFEPRLQAAFKNWMKILLTEPNPYTGIPLKDDPAFAILQIVSEDTLLFYWFNSIHGGPRRELERQFADWAIRRYGSLESALEVWDNRTLEDDAPGEGRLALFPIHELHQPQTPELSRRYQDQVEFLARTERAFYEEMIRYIKEDLGAGQLVTASNFGPSDPVRLGDLQRWIWTAGDAIERNNFYNVVHKGKGSAWKIEPGHFFTVRSATRDPGIPQIRKLVVGKPMNLSSTTWLLPNLYTAEGPLIAASYASMNGIDGFFWFAATAPGYHEQPFMNWAGKAGEHPIHKWSLSHPGLLSQFPAAALIFRQQLVDPAATVVHEERTFEEMIRRVPPLLAQDMEYQPAEFVSEVPAERRDLQQTVKPEAFLIGRVETVYEGDPARSVATELKPYLGENGSEIRTTHDQLVLDRETGLLTIQAPSAQGVVGFLAEAGGTFRLPDLEITSGNDYASIVAVSMDGRPLSASRKILVQFGAAVRPTGWEVAADSREIDGVAVEGFRIVKTGELPWRMRTARGRLVLNNPTITRVAHLDSGGALIEDLPVEREGDRIAFDLPPDALYLLLSDGER
ncbi:MAG: hypothetical protein ACLFSZ_10700 [Puniceicoccaceae bacterium]